MLILKILFVCLLFMIPVVLMVLAAKSFLGAASTLNDLFNPAEKTEQLKRGKWIAREDLNPRGTIDADGEILPVVSESGFIGKGAKVIVTGYRQFQWTVRRSSD